MTLPMWEWKPIGNLFDISAGKNMSATARAGTNRVQFLRTSNVFWDEIDLENVDSMSFSDNEREAKLLRTGDMLVCEGGDIGRAALWTGEREVMSFQNHLHCLRPVSDDVVPHFYVYFLQCAFTQLGIFEGAGNKTTIPNLSRNRLAQLEVPVPPVAEQRAIAACLASVRKAFQLQERAICIAEKLMAGAMYELFISGLRGEEKKETETNRTPPFWTIGSIKQFARFQRGFDITKATQSHGRIPVVSSGGIRSYHNEVGATGPGVIIGRKGSIGTLHYVDTDYWPHDTTLWCTDFCGNIPRFVYYRLQNVDMKRLDSGSTNPALNRNLLHEELVSWPDISEQREIVDILDTIDSKISLHKRKRSVLDSLFKSLLHKLMTGEIRVSDLNLAALDSHTAAGTAA